MDSSAPQTVLKGVAITSSLCGTIGGLYGGLKHGSPSKFFMYSAVNSGIVAATFFSIREYVVSPILISTLHTRQPAIGSMLEEPVSLSWVDIRMSRLLDSGLSGGLAGGILNAWKRGRGGLIPGLTTGALMCTLVQWCFNEFNIFRIRYVSANSIAQHAIHSSIDASQSPPAEPTMQPAPSETPTYRSPMDRVLLMFGQRISDEKYLERLRTKRDSHLRRIAELEDKEKQQ